MNKLIPLLGFLFIASFSMIAQDGSFAFGVKGGLTLGFQQWNNIERQLLYKMHGIAFLESAPEEDKFIFYSQLGYHLKGSAIRNRNFFNPINMNITKPPAQEFVFRNLSMVLGVKSKTNFGLNGKAYYLLGVRVDYTLSTNLKEYEAYNEFCRCAFYPFEGGVKKFNYGVSAGGGIEFPFNDLIRGVLEFTVNPDFSRQYEQPRIDNVYDPYTGNNRTLSERIIRNLTFEITAGFRFLRKVEYID